MNLPEVVPASFNVPQLELQQEMADALPKFNVDMSPKQSFSRKISAEDIEWGKKHVREHTVDSVPGIDDFSYRDILAMCNVALRELLQACLDKGSAPSLWLAALVIGLLKRGKEPTDPESHRLVVLECALLKFLMLILDRRIREYSEDAGLLPRTQNAFREGYRTNNNSFMLRVMADRALAEGRTLILGYVDLKNAFPATNRAVLWNRLHSDGIWGPYIDWIMMMYDQMRYMVRLNGQLSEVFQSILGLLTGDPTSPNLWNIFLRMLRLAVFPEDTRINGKSVPKLEQADDLLILSGSPASFQEKLNDTATQMGDVGCEVQELKCEFAIAGVRPKEKLDFALNGKPLKEVSVMKYVGIWHDFRSKDMYSEHHRVYTEKARNVANVCLGVSRIVGDLPLWDARTLYMARVDPYLISGADICPDIVESRLLEKEAVQHHYLRRMLGLTTRSMTAILFSETGLEPIRYRRAKQMINYLAHLVALKDKDRLVADGLLDSMDLARQQKISWINDICVVLAKLPIPVYWDLREANAISSDTVASLLKGLQYSMEESIQASIMSYSKTRDLFADRLEMVDKKLVRKVLCFRSYLRVANEKHRRALTHVLLSGHALASERMTWGQRDRPESVPEQWRLCRFCKVCVEDTVHALFGCKHEPLLKLRRDFFARLFHSLPDMKGKHTDAGLFFRDLISRRKTISLLAKYAYDVLEIFYATAMLIINPAFYRPLAQIAVDPHPA